MIKVLKLFLQSFLFERGSFRFALTMVLGLAFSMAVILATIGIMEGFEWSLKKGLKRSTGDISFFSHEGFFHYPGGIVPELQNLEVEEYTPLVHTEAFVVSNDKSKGVLVKGVEPQSFLQVTGMDLTNLRNAQVAIGRQLALQLELKPGDEVTLALASGHQGFAGLPLLYRVKIVQVIDHGVYQKDLRYIYMQLSELQQLLQVNGKVNIISLNAPKLSGNSKHQPADQDIENVEKFLNLMETKMGEDFRIRPYWSEFSSLFKAVEVEKVMIGLILQVIVVIAIFNVIAFIVFINEKRAQELFMFKALGLSQGAMVHGWMSVIFISWFFSCWLSIGLVRVFGMALRHLSVFQLPGDIYYLERLDLLLQPQDYGLVFCLSLIWLLALSYIGLRKVKKRSLLYGLRKEFA